MTSRFQLFLVCYLLEIFRADIAERALFRSCFTFMYITANETYIFLAHDFKYLNS